MDGQVNTRQAAVVHTPCKNMEAVFEQEYQKGEISGIFLMTNMAPKVIEDLTKELKTREAGLPLEEE